MYEITCLDDKGNSINNFVQWDCNQKVRIVLEGVDKDYFEIVPQMHFANVKSQEALVVREPNVKIATTETENDTIIADVPNQLLQEAYPLLVYVYFEEGNEGDYAYLEPDATNYDAASPQRTILATEIPVRKRAKPSDYVYVENIERITAEQIKKELGNDISNGELLIKYLTFIDLQNEKQHRIYVSNHKMTLEDLEEEGEDAPAEADGDLWAMTELEINRWLGLNSMTYAVDLEEIGCTDLDDLLTVGTYVYNGSTPITNSPVDTKYRVFVGRTLNSTPYESDYTSQEVLKASTGERSYRTFDGSTWSKWCRQLNTNSVLEIENGGTGATTTKSAQYNLLNDMNELTNIAGDSSNFVFAYPSPSADNGTVYKRKGSKVWEWIYNKICSTFGFNVDNVLSIEHGGTGHTTPEGALENLGLTATADEINHLDGITADVNELNVLDGITPTTTELNYVKGVTSSIQTQLDDNKAGAKLYTDTSIANLIDSAPETLDTLKEISDALAEDDAVMDTLNTAIGTKANKDDFDAHVSDYNDHIANVDNPHAVTLTQLGVTAEADELNKLNGVSVSTDEINYLSGVTDNIQSQLNDKSSSSHTHDYAGSSSSGGAATSAVKLDTPCSIVTDLESTTAASFDGSADITVGVSGILPIENGGTGASDSLTARVNLGIMDEANVLSAYPVGSYYFSHVATSPAELFGGEWASVTGKFLYMNAGTGTGGNNTHTLTVAQIPSHRHDSILSSWGTPLTHGNGDYADLAGGGYGPWFGNGWGMQGSVSTSYTGGSTAHNNMPAYQTVYAWRRTA